MMKLKVFYLPKNNTWKQRLTIIFYTLVGWQWSLTLSEDFVNKMAEDIKAEKEKNKV